MTAQAPTTAPATTPPGSVPPQGFRNEPVLELRRADVRDRLGPALDALDATLPRRVPVLLADGERHGEDLVSTDPADPSRVVARAAAATPGEVDRALAAARPWDAPVEERARVLRQAAQWLRDRRLEATALAVREAGKPWPEADADVAEAIDFLEYYAQGALELAAGPELVQVPGERNTLRYAPRGVTAVIAPWNFPLAIPLGMTAAALATGNAALLKPAEQTPGCAGLLADALRESGVPPTAFQLLPGEGDVGAALVADPRVHTIAFTGSRDVGLKILEEAAKVRPGQGHIKRVVAELGGKNCVLVDADADLDEVVPALVESAFAYAGQKCSAASRALVHDAVHDELVERLRGRVEQLQVGPASALATDVPALVDAESRERLEAAAATAERDGRVVARAAGGAVPAAGHFFAPTLVADLPAGHDLLADELFGPLLCVERVRDLDEACDRVDASPYALTGGLFARNPLVVERVVARSPVGNLYVNRGTTGAMVGRQPFGGNRLSGTGTKAGGPGYLLQFVEPRVVTESTMRHGLVV